jgi:hypothetical protein
MHLPCDLDAPSRYLAVTVAQVEYWNDAGVDGAGVEAEADFYRPEARLTVALQLCPGYSLLHQESWHPIRAMSCIQLPMIS